MAVLLSIPEYELEVLRDALEAYLDDRSMYEAGEDTSESKRKSLRLEQEKCKRLLSYLPEPRLSSR